mgnify:CR=1 FL=1
MKLVYKVFKSPTGLTTQVTRFGPYSYQQYLRDIYYPWRQRKNPWYGLGLKYVDRGQWMTRFMKTNISYKENKWKL